METQEIRPPEAQQLWKTEANRKAGPAVPLVDILEDQSEIVLVADMPGVEKENLTISVEDDVLSLEGNLSLNVPDDATPLLAEFNARTYKRSFTLSKELDTSRIQAEMKSGVLRLTIPKNDASKPRKIEVHGD